jgi:hypothetical protein
MPTTQGGPCTGTCDDHFAVDISLSDTWECRQIAWGDPSQERRGTAATFHPAAIIGIQLQFAPATAFTLYVDDLAFWSEGGGPGGAGGGGGVPAGAPRASRAVPAARQQGPAAWAASVAAATPAARWQGLAAPE